MANNKKYEKDEAIRHCKETVSSSRLKRGLMLCGMAVRVGRDLVKASRNKHTSKDGLDEGVDFGVEKRTTRVFGTLGEMKGLALKAGQMLSYVESDLPVEYKALLSGLQSSAPSMGIETVRQVIEEQLGESPERVFASFDEEPLAAASIGQVHRGMSRQAV